MKRTRRLTMTVGAAVLWAAAIGLYPVWGHAATLQDVEKTWGKPARVQTLNAGAEKRFYPYNGTMEDIGYRYFTFRDGEVVEDGVTGSLPAAGPAGKKGLPSATVDAALYTTVESIDRAWGKPVAVRNLDDGSEERYYGFQGTMEDIGFRYFVLKNGQVVAGGIAGNIAVEPTREARGIRVVTGVIPEAGAQSIEEVEHTWGKPAMVRKLDNGMEERYYKYGSTQEDIGYRMFLFKDGKVAGSAIAS